jgi:4'-phosphopantetheinyl transferase
MIHDCNGWNSPPTQLRMATGEVHLFRAGLDQAATRVTKLERTLSRDERARAGRFCLARDRRRFVVARGALREILGSILSEDPAALEFAYGAVGKPRLVRRNGADRLHFNVAHSDSMAVFAIAADDVGVDVERLRTIEDAEQIASRFFSSRESDSLRSLPVDQRTEGFFNCWTRKEACVKAVGCGLSDAIRHIEVSLVPGEPARLFSAPDEMQAKGEWTLHTFKPAADYLGAVAVRRKTLRTDQWSWSGE